MSIRMCRACEFQTGNALMEICARCGEDFDDVMPEKVAAKEAEELAANPPRALDDMSSAELRELASSMGHRGVSKVKKAELIALIQGTNEEASE